MESNGVGLGYEERDGVSVAWIGMSGVELKVTKESSYGSVFLGMN